MHREKVKSRTHWEANSEDDLEASYRHRKPYTEIKFSKYSGGDPRGWILKPENFFRYGRAKSRCCLHVPRRKCSWLVCFCESGENNHVMGWTCQGPSRELWPTQSLEPGWISLRHQADRDGAGISIGVHSMLRMGEELAGSLSIRRFYEWAQGRIAYRCVIT